MEGKSLFEIWNLRSQIDGMTSDSKETHTRQVLNCASAIRKVRVRSMKFLAGRVSGCSSKPGALKSVSKFEI